MRLTSGGRGTCPLGLGPPTPASPPTAGEEGGMYYTVVVIGGSLWVLIDVPGSATREEAKRRWPWEVGKDEVAFE